MRFLRILTCFLLAVPVLADTVVFRNVNVVTMTSPKVLEKQSVVVQDGNIVSVSKSPKVAAGATVIDGKGKYLMPGLADMHVQIPGSDAKGGLMTDVLTMLVTNGVTTARGMWGLPGHLEIREKAKLGQVVAPNLVLAGPIFSSETVVTPEEAAARVRIQKKEGWDLLSLHYTLTRDQYDAVVKAAREEGMRFAGQVPDMLHAIEMKQETIDSMDMFNGALQTPKGPVDEAKLAELAKKIKDAGVWIVPTNAITEITFGATPLQTLNAYPENKYSPKAAIEFWTNSYNQRVAGISRDQAANVVANNRRIIRALNQAGVKLLLGTNALEQYTQPGFSVAREMASLRGAGLPAYDILRMATVNPAIYLGKQDSVGTVEAGKRADLVLLDANPLADVTNVSKVSGVMIGGHWIDRAQIDSALKRITEKYRH